MLCFDRLGLRSYDGDGRRQPGGCIAQDFPVTDSQRLDPALLSQGQPDEKTELNQFLGGKVLMQLLPQRVVSNFRIPDNRARIGQRDLLPF